MPNPAADEARAFSDRDLAEAINEAYREVFNLQFQKGTRQLQNPLAIRHARRQIARLRTVQRARLLAQVAGAPIEPVDAPSAPGISPQKRRAQEERAARGAAAAAAAEADAAEAGEATGEDAGSAAPPHEPAASDETLPDGEEEKAEEKAEEEEEEEEEEE